MELEELYGKFYKEILAYCAAMTKSAAAAEDLVQETYLRAMTHWGIWRTSPGDSAGRGSTRPPGTSSSTRHGSSPVRPRRMRSSWPWPPSRRT